MLWASLLLKGNIDCPGLLCIRIMATGLGLWQQGSILAASSTPESGSCGGTGPIPHREWGCTFVTVKWPLSQVVIGWGQLRYEEGN